MSYSYATESLLEIFLFESSQQLEQLEHTILSLEKESIFLEDTVNEIFRIMHTIKGSAAMMQFDQIAAVAHSIEDLFFYLRRERPKGVDFSELSDMVLQSVDFIKIEMNKIKNQQPVDGNAAELIEQNKQYLLYMKEVSAAKTQPAEKMSRNNYKAIVYFEDGCEMENVRAYTLIHNLKDMVEECTFYPEDIIDSDDSIFIIRKNGFQINFTTTISYEKILSFFQQTLFLKDLELIQQEQEEKKCELPGSVPSSEKVITVSDEKSKAVNMDRTEQSAPQQSIISVNVNKLDQLLDFVGEMVIAEAMVVQNPDLDGLELDNFKKAARQLSKITSKIQDMVMSIRMVPLSATFHKMHRIVRDMGKKLEKEIQLEIIGDETEVDKNIIEHISDPLMHLVRNSVDHGLEEGEERVALGKPRAGRITLEAKNSGSDVLIIVRDDGKGISKEKVLIKAKENGLLMKPEKEMTDREIFNLILLPGFSTKESVTEFSGRGVGMDVVTKNIEYIGGSIAVDSQEGKGTAITIKIPLTLAIIDGMNLQVGEARYTIPTISIKEAFRPKASDIIYDPDGNEILMVRGNCYPILRLHSLYQVETTITELTEGIILMIEQDGKSVGIFADALLGQQQVVVKALPAYLQSFRRLNSLAGCTLLGDGSISLILDTGKMLNRL